MGRLCGWGGAARRGEVAGGARLSLSLRLFSRGRRGERSPSFDELAAFGGGIGAARERLEGGKGVEAEEHLAVDEQGRHAERTARERVVGVAAKALFALGDRARRERRRLDAGTRENGRHTLGPLDSLARSPRRLEESLDDSPCERAIDVERRD